MSLDIDDVRCGDIVGLESGDEGEVINIDTAKNTLAVEIETEDGVSHVEVFADEPWLTFVSQGDP